MKTKTTMAGALLLWFAYEITFDPMVIIQIITLGGLAQ